MAARPFMLRAESIASPLGDEVDKTSGGSVTRAVTYYPAGGATLAHTAFPGTARQGRCGAVQV